MGRSLEGPLTLRGSQGLDGVYEEVAESMMSVHSRGCVRSRESLSGVFHRLHAVALNGGIAR